MPITEEFDSPRRTLPPVLTLVIALVVVAVFIIGIAYIFRSKPLAQGQIDNVFISQNKGQPNSMVAIQVSLQAMGDKPIYIKGITAELKTQNDTYTDDAASAFRLRSLFPGIPRPERTRHEAASGRDQDSAGTQESGSVIVTFPIDQGEFDTRKSLTVTVQPYDQKPIVLKEAGK